MTKRLIRILCGMLAATGLVLAGTASAGLGAGTVTATPEKNSVGDTVAINATGDCAEHGSGSTLIVVVKGPDGSELDHRELPGTSDTDFMFDQTEQTGVYTVTADCDVEEIGDPIVAEGSTTTDGAAGPAAVLYSYEPDTFEVFEPGVSATAVFTNDPASPTVGVIAGSPTFTG